MVELHGTVHEEELSICTDAFVDDEENTVRRCSFSSSMPSDTNGHLAASCINKF